MKGSRLGSYQVLAELGSGGMGRVYRAEVVRGAAGLDVGTAVALKVIHAHLLEQEGFFKRFLREAQIGQHVRHENVVRCFDCDATLVDGRQQNFLVMEYVEGQTLRDLLLELERVPEELCRHIGREVANGLAAIHEAGVVHRDLKPENVLITPEHVVKVMDLGVARLQDEAIRLSQAGVFLGSLEYAAPEQFRSRDVEVDGRADLHALGVLLYELATGQHPYRNEDASKVIRNILEVEPRKLGEVNPQLSAFFEEVVHALIAKDREKRFPSASDLAVVLREGEKGAWWAQRANALHVETRRPLRRVRVPRETGLYGRDDDLARLQALYAQAKAGDGRVLLIDGEAGIGKTRLVDEFVGRLRQQGEDVNFLFGSYPPGGAATAAGAFSTAYREHFGAEALGETLRGYLADTPLLVPAFAALLKGDAVPTGAEPLTRESLQTVFVRATHGLAAERPTIVLIDDLHFAPEDGRALFASLALAAPEHRILLLGTMRPGLTGPWIAGLERLEQSARMTLGRLGAKDLARLLENAFHSERLAAELGHRIALKCDGNPYFTFEIIRGLREGQFITQQADGRWVTSKVIRNIQVPSSVLELVNARISDLSDEEHDLLDVAACCGFEFDPLLVGHVLGLGQIPTMKRLAHVEKKHRLIRAAGLNYVFDHHQVQEGLYEGLHERLRQPYHAAIARALETRAGAAGSAPEGLDGALCVELCEHYLKGDEGEHALRYLGAALAHLEGGYLNDHAVRLADRALAVPGLLQGVARCDVLLRKNERLDALGDRQAQDATLQEALALAETAGAKDSTMRALRALGVLRHWSGEFAESLEHSTRAAALAHEIGDRDTEARALGNVGIAHYALGRYDDAALHYERWLAIAREIGDLGSEARATGNLGNVYYATGRAEEALTHYQRARDLARETGNTSSEAAFTGNLGLALSSRGRYEEATACQERYLALARQVGNRRNEAVACGFLGNVHLALGRAELAREHQERALAIGREIGDRQAEVSALANLGCALQALGRYADAQVQFERCLEIAPAMKHRWGEAFARGGLGSLWLDLGDHAAARRDLEAALASWLEIGAHRWACGPMGNLARLAGEEGDLQDACRRLREVIALEREKGSPGGAAESLLLLADFQRHTGECDAARGTAQESLALLRLQGQSALVARAQALLAVLGEADVREAEASLARAGATADGPDVRLYLWEATRGCEHLAAAKRFVDERVVNAPETHRASILAGVRLHRAIMDAWERHGE